MNKLMIGILLTTSVAGNCWFYVDKLHSQQYLQATQNELMNTNDQLDNTVKELDITRSDLWTSQNRINDLEIQVQDLTGKYQDLSKKYESTSKKLETMSRGGDMSSNTLYMVATAYTHTGNATYTGVMPKVGRTIAVDPRIIPLGSRLYIEGIGYCKAEDTGGDIKGNRIDIFMNSESECVEFGRKTVKVMVLK